LVGSGLDGGTCLIGVLDAFILGILLYKINISSQSITGKGTEAKISGKI